MQTSLSRHSLLLAADAGGRLFVVHALAFVRRHALLVGQLCLAIAVWKSGLIGRLLAIALFASIVRLLLGSLATYAGMDSLDALADALYYVTVTTVFPLLALWHFMIQKAASS